MSHPNRFGVSTIYGRNIYMETTATAEFTLATAKTHMYKYAALTVLREHQFICAIMTLAFTTNTKKNNT